MESKFKKNILSYTMILFGVVIATLLLAKYFKEKGIKIDSTASTIKDETTATEKSYWDKFIEFFGENNILPTDYDWLTTTTGKFLETYLGNYTNFIIWALLVLAIWWLVFTIFELLTGLKGYRKVEYGISGLLFFLVLLGAFILAITNANKDSETKVTRSSFVELKKFPRAANGLELVVDMGVTQTAQIGLHMTSPRLHGMGKAFWACTEVIKPQVFADSLNFEVTPESRGNYTNKIRLTQKSRDMLIDNGIIDIQVKFTQTLGTPTQSPCKHLK